MNGIAILGALPGSPAERCGLKYGDVLLSVNGQAMSTVEDFLKARSAAKESMDVLVRRGAHVMELTLELDKEKSAPQLERATATLDRVNHLRLVPPAENHEPLN